MERAPPTAKAIACVLLATAIVAASAWSVDRPPHGVTFSGVVTRVVDGDTVEVEVRRTVRVRLLDCWSPETRTTDDDEKRRGLAAKRYLSEIALRKRATVFVPIDPDARFGDSMTFGRALGHVWLDGEDDSLSEMMVSSGHGTVTRDGK
mgnify:CR=1 FL=1